MQQKVINPDWVEKKIGSVQTATEMNTIVDALKKNAEVLDSVLTTQNNKQFQEVVAVNNQLSIDVSKTPYAKYTFAKTDKDVILNFVNFEEGSYGEIFITQPGFKTMILGQGVVGELNLPNAVNTTALILYSVINGVVNVYGHDIVADNEKDLPAKISDFSIIYSDAQICSTKWSSPFSGTPGEAVTRYDMRYAMSAVNADDIKVWNSMTVLPNMPDILPEGTTQTYLIKNLKANQEYYVYLKAIKVRDGVSYTSKASDFLYFKTVGSSDPTKSSRIPLTAKNIFTRNPSDIGLDQNQVPVPKSELMIDELEKITFLPTGLPDTTSRPFSTYWDIFKFDRTLLSNCPIIIDLNDQFTIDKVFIFSMNGNAKANLYGMKDVGYDWVLINELNLPWNNWHTSICGNASYRFLKIDYDRIYENDNGGEIIPPFAHYNGDIKDIGNVMIYGSTSSLKPATVLPPKRRAFEMPTVDNFFCVNCHAYQDGRIHSFVSGPMARMYIPYGHFCARDLNNQLITPTFKNLSDVVYKMNNIGWVKGNNGTGKSFEQHLTDTYKKWGLKPYITNSASTLDYTVFNEHWDQYPKAKKNNRMVDDYWLPNAWRPRVTQAKHGFDRYYGITKDPMHYKTLAKLAYTFSAKFGSVATAGTDLPIFKSDAYDTEENTNTGLNLISGLEPGNEMDKSWEEWTGYTEPEEEAALCSAFCDGHMSEINKSENNSKSYGLKNADPKLKMITPGTAGTASTRYMRELMHYAKTRNDGKMPFDMLALHIYSSSVGANQQSSKDPVQYAIPFEDLIDSLGGSEIKRTIDLRDRFAPTKEIIVNEIGYGEGGKRQSASSLQCYSQPGNIINGWTIPDRHRSEVKGAWTVRAAIKLMEMGVSLMNYYSTENEGSFFSWNAGASGAGYEMFHWNDCVDETPGAKVAAIEQYEVKENRGSFSAMGLVGQIIGNGTYPLTNSFWWVSTFRNRLKDYKFTGYKYVSNSKVVIACFKHKTDDKGCYVVYYREPITTDPGRPQQGAANVLIPLPKNINNVLNVSVYLPKLPNPQEVKGVWNDKLCSKERLPTSIVTEHPDGTRTCVFPTKEENPYFPLVGACDTISERINDYVYANQYVRYDDIEGKYKKEYSTPLYLRQLHANCDFVEFHPEGIKGSHGIEKNIHISGDVLNINVSEFPEYYFFDAVPEVDYKSTVSDVVATAINSSSIKLYWNNNNIEDSGYEIFTSNLPETGYTLYTTVNAGVENSTIISGLPSNQILYLKVRPISGLKKGDLSEYTSVRTPADLPEPTNLHITNKTASTISLAFDCDTNFDGFVKYIIYRAVGDSIFTAIGNIDDKSIKTFTDSNLISGTYYSYRIKVIGLNGTSDYSNTITDRTSLPEEASPTILDATTDKFGTNIIVTFDIPLKQDINKANVIAALSLTENGIVKQIIDVFVDPNNYNILVVKVKDDSLLQYSSYANLRLLYTSVGSSLISSYNTPVESFDKRIVNIIGNFTNIYATYKINLARISADVPTSKDWCNLVGIPENSDVYNKPFPPLTDTFERVSNISVTAMRIDNAVPKSKWGGGESGRSQCTIADIPVEVSRSRWHTWWADNFSDEASVSRLKFDGMNSKNKYDIVVFPSSPNNDSLPRNVKFKINGKYSNTVDSTNNKAGVLHLEDVTCDTSGSLNLDFITLTTSDNRFACGICYIEIVERVSDTVITSYEPYISSVKILEDVDNTGIVYSKDITIRPNYVGTATEYQIAETPDFANTTLTQYVGGDINYTCSSAFGEKTLYIKLKNSIGFSNTKVVKIMVVDPLAALEFKGLYSVTGKNFTYNNTFNVGITKSGTVTHYRYSVGTDINVASWVIYPTSENFLASLGTVFGEKIIYVQLKNNYKESDIKTINVKYNEFIGDTVTLDIAVPQTIDIDNVNVYIPNLKYNKKVAASLVVDDSWSIWNNFFAVVNKKWVDDELKSFFDPADTRDFMNHWKWEYQGHTKTTGYIPNDFLEVSSGTGFTKRFACSVALIKGWTTGVNEDAGIFTPWIGSPEMRYMIDFGNTVNFHNIDGVTDATTQDEFNRLTKIDSDYYYSLFGIRPKINTTPDGNPLYWGRAWMCPDMQYSIDATRRQGGDGTLDYYYFNRRSYDIADKTLKRLMQRDFWVGSYTPEIWANSVLESRQKPASDRNFRIFGTHKLYTNSLAPLLVKLNNTLGLKGDDSLWFTSIDEFLEYQFMVDRSEIIKTIENGKIKLVLKLPKQDNFIFRDATIMLTGIPSVNEISVTASNNCEGLSYGISDGNLMINFDFNGNLLSKSNKYIDKFEASSVLSDYEDAVYFTNMLRPDLKATQEARLLALSAAPVLQSVTVPSTTVSSQSISVTPTFTGRVTDIMVSESPTFAGATWSAYKTGAVSFSITNTLGDHTIYVKLKNGTKESAVASLVVTYSVDPLIMQTFVINNGATTTDALPLKITYTYTGHRPTHYMISDTSGFVGAVWADVATQPILFTPTDTTNGVKNVFFKLKNEFVETASSNASITYNKVELAVTAKATSSTGDTTVTYTRDVNINLISAGSPTHMCIRESSAITSWINYVDVSTFTLSAGYGLKTIYVSVKNGDNIVTTQTTITYSEKPLVGMKIFLARHGNVNGGDDFRQPIDGIYWNKIFDLFNPTNPYKFDVKDTSNVTRATSSANPSVIDSTALLAQYGIVALSSIPSNSKLPVTTSLTTYAPGFFRTAWWVYGDGTLAKSRYIILKDLPAGKYKVSFFNNGDTAGSFTGSKYFCNGISVNCNTQVADNINNPTIINDVTVAANALTVLAWYGTSGCITAIELEYISA